MTFDRRAALLALTERELAKGMGTEMQQKAYQEMEWRRCERSVTYFLERYGYILHGGRVIKWHLWPIQKWVLEDLQSHISVVGVKARQLGITTVVSHFTLWDVIFHDATTWDNISSSEEKAKDIIKRIQATKDRLPPWLIGRAQARNVAVTGRGYASRKDKSDSITRVSFGLSEMKIATSTVKSIQGASNNINLDEATLHTDLKRKLQQMHATLDGAGGVGAVIANGAGEDDFFWFYQQAKQGENGFKPYFFWWGDAPPRLKDATITTDDGVIKAVPLDSYGNWHFPGVTRAQLMNHAAQGRLTSPWYDTMERKFLTDNPEADKFAFKAVFPTTEQEAFYISASCRFSLSALNNIREHILEESQKGTIGYKHLRGYLERTEGGKVDITIHHKGRWRVYSMPRAGGKYVFGIDPAAGGESGDYSVIQVCEMTGDQHLKQCAVFQAKCEGPLLAMEAIKAGEWYNDAYLVPEANMGQLLIEYLKSDYWNLYMRKAKTDRFSSTQSSNNIGFWADRASKPRLIGNLAEWLTQGRIELVDPETLNELGHYEIKDDGIQTGAPKGMHDDLVMALGLAVEGVIDMDSYFVNTEIRALASWEE
jgi:hypothetical protein